MRSASFVALALAAGAALGCAGDRATGPTNNAAARAATELERAAADFGMVAVPTAALAYHGAAAALRAGARVTDVQISVDGKAETWYAFGHEMRILPPAGSAPDGFEPLMLRSLLAWQLGRSGGIRVIHLITAGSETDIQGLSSGPTVTADAPLEVPSFLIYAEGRNAVWEAVGGRQKSSVAATNTPCPEPRDRPAGAPPSPACVEAGFTFELTGIEARPFVPPFHRVGAPPNTASGTRAISMPSQAVAGIQVAMTLPAFPFAPIAGRALP